MAAPANGESPAPLESSEQAELAPEHAGTVDVAPAGEPAGPGQREQVGEAAEGQAP